MTDIAGKIEYIESKIPEYVKLVIVSKTRSVEEILIAYNTGHKLFGENKVQELLNKKNQLPGEIQWHLIGHLQSNKVKYIVPFISLIQSVDTLKLLKTINKEASRINRVVDCLLQIHIASEETKYGFSLLELESAFETVKPADFKYIRICGVMGMATFTSDRKVLQKEFDNLKGIYDALKTRYFSESESFVEISMGMSGDYEIALESGSTIIRIGSMIFGERK